MRRIFKILRNDTIFLLGISLLVILLTELPFIYGYFINDHRHYFTGLNTIAVIDGPVYLSYIEQVKAGHYLFSDLFNSNDNFQFFNPFWLLVGLVARIFNLAGTLTLQLFRIILIPFFLWALFRIIKLFLPGTDWQKKTCFLLALIYSGFGIFFLPLAYLNTLKPDLAKVPIDLWAYESSIFMVLRYYPHVLLAIGLIFLIFYYFYLGIEKNNWAKASLAGWLALLLFSFHPFQIPLIYGVLLVFALVMAFKNKKFGSYLGKYLLLLLISCPAVFYYFDQLFINENMFLKAVQNNNLMPGFWLFILSFGLAFLLACSELVIIIKKKNFSSANIFLIVWFLTTIFLVYSPLNFQRRMLGGFIVPIIILAFIVLLEIYKKIADLPGNLKNFLAVIFFLFVSLTNLFIYSQDFRAYWLSINYAQIEHQDLMYIDNDVKGALDWYKCTATSNDIILTSYERGNLIPGLTGQKVYWGHPIETVGFRGKRQKVEAFFAANNLDLEKIDFLKTNKITYLFYSEFEKKLGDFDPTQKKYLKAVWQNPAVTIYKINLEL